MKTKYFILAATAITMMASCADEKFVGDENLLGAANGEEAISFGSGTPAVTRADATGATAAGLLNRNFVVFGYKTPTTGPVQTVFNNYQANYVANTEHTTTTNSAGWEYVGYKNLTATMTGNTGVAGNTTSGNDQTIKYWDYSATNYKFYAYSLGAGKTGSPNTYANGSTMSTSDSYTLEGDQDQLAACYISELKTIENPDGSTAKEVDLRFLSIKSKIQLGFYETIPGYSVKSLKFYATSGAGSSTTTPALYAGSSILPKAGTYTITFDGDGKPQLAWAAAADDGTQENITFSTDPSALTNLAGKDYLEEDATQYLGRASNQATKTQEKLVLPYANGADLTLKVDYTLVSRDGSGETIEAVGATAVVPAAYTQWKPNYKYTYLFKISDKSNPLIGGVEGLYPITLDAVVASEQDGSQETITTVSEPSITTYAKESAVITDNEYKTGNTIYAAVEDAAVDPSNPVLTVGTNAKLYTATIEDGAAQDITEQTVANAIASGAAGYDAGTVLTAGTLLDGYYTKAAEVYTECTPSTYADGSTTYYRSADKVVTDALGKKLAVFDASSGLTAVTEIAAGDSPTGVAISIKGAKFSPAEATYTRIADGTTLPIGTYYTADDGSTTEDLAASKTTTSSDNYYYKTSTAGYYVLEYWRGAQGGEPFVAATGTFVTGTKYYTDATGETEVDTTLFENGVTNVSSYYVKNSEYKPAVKIYKVIKVVD